VPTPAQAPAPSAPGATGSGAALLRAPLPGQLAEVSVAVGERVSRGQAVAVLEAMKMKNTIRSPRDGIVAEVRVQAGQTVAHGDVLLRFEETGDER
jgi:glutaconyl-CoA/methylmalonyl-CoA decarboxylase subunit gamma